MGDRATRQTLIDTNDNEINPATEDKQDNIITELQAVSDTPESFEDTSFVTGDSPATLDINAALGRNATKGYIVNDGAGDFTIAFSIDGTNFGDDHTIKKDEIFEFRDISVDSIRITHEGTDSSYRISVI